MVGDDARRPGLGEAQLGIGVQIATPCDDLRRPRLHGSLDIRQRNLGGRSAGGAGQNGDGGGKQAAQGHGGGFRLSKSAGDVTRPLRASPSAV
ncbi:hypothetical protein GCM10009422_29140 [Brevundimonas kwangchunensis]|uniref:Uncharacterized protein n=1 Tax=Brevundimonas kwangchunensis TaxID=322163 RepID=A0ABN1H5U5_9CAUL